VEMSSPMRIRTGTQISWPSGDPVHF